MTMPGALLFTKNGEWVHDGTVVTHPGVQRYFSTHLRFSEEHGGYVIEVEGKCVRVEIEDTPHVVRSIDTTALPWHIRLETGQSEPFRPETFSVGTDNVFYCRDKDNAWLRILRPAAQTLVRYIEEGPTGVAMLVCCGGEFRIAVRNESPD